MEEKILVTYATTHGSTQEIAEVVADTLRASELAVDLLPMRNVRSLQAYRAVVFGAPLYMFHLHKDALRFLAQHRKALTQGIPIAIFAGGPIEVGKDEQWQEVQAQLEKELQKFPWLRPAAVQVVGGSFDPTRLRFPWNLIPALKHTPASDLRDWEAIRDWAASLPKQFPLAGLERQPVAASH